MPIFAPLSSLIRSLKLCFKLIAEVAHLVEHDLAKVGVAGSSPVFRSSVLRRLAEDFFYQALVVELVDTQDLKSCLQQCGCGFNSRLGHSKSAT